MSLTDWHTSWALLLGWSWRRNSWLRSCPQPCSGGGFLISQGHHQEGLQQDGHHHDTSVSLHYQQLWGSSDSWQFGRAGPLQTPHTGSCPRCWVWHSAAQFWSLWTGAPENGDMLIIVLWQLAMTAWTCHLSRIFTKRTFLMYNEPKQSFLQ